MKMFHLLRMEDESGISGTGVIAEGVEFTDGVVVMRWTTDHKSTAIYESVKDVQTIHGHGGKTQIIWRE
jgi:hypothetical protein